MIFLKRPTFFSPVFSAVGCFVEADNRMLLLKRADATREQNFPDTWGLPSGKIEDGEGQYEAMLRELREETGIIANVQYLQFLKMIYVKYEELAKQFEYYIFKLCLDCVPHVQLSNEHVAFAWTPVASSFSYALMPDLDHCIRLAYGIGSP